MTPNKALLVWARETSGLTVEEAANKLGLAPERLAAWETGKQRPSIAQLRKIAGAYKRPLAVFYLPEPPRGFQPLRDFRRLPETDARRLSPPLQAAIRRAHTQREAALELRDLADEPVRDAPRLEQVPREVEQFGAAARSPRPRPCVLFNYNERIVMPQEDPLDQCSPELRAEFDELMRHAERVGAVDSYPSRDIARSHVTLLRPCRERVGGGCGGHFSVSFRVNGSGDRGARVGAAYGKVGAARSSSTYRRWAIPVGSLVASTAGVAEAPQHKLPPIAPR